MNRRLLRGLGLAPAAVLVFSACSAGGGMAAAAGAPAAPARAATVAPAATPAPGDPPAIHWASTSAEHRAAFLQTYRFIAGSISAAADGRRAGSWAVVMDADETVLDNSEYQRRRARMGLGFTPDSWNEWVREEAAPALPGAVAFVRHVRELGGRVAIVTNRTEEICEATRRNLGDVGLDADVVLCRQPDDSGKEGRFRSVQEGTTHADLPPLEVVAWVGDNIRDFPGGSQALATADLRGLEDFGARFFVLPNPMYGSWEGNPPF